MAQPLAILTSPVDADTAIEQSARWGAAEETRARPGGHRPLRCHGLNAARRNFP
jgi:hypothetical protein